MNNISTIEVKDINSVKRYASQYVNGEQVTLITKDGTKYYTDGKGGYFLLGEQITSGERPQDTGKVELMTALKEISKNVDILKAFSKDNDGNLCFEGKKISIATETADTLLTSE